MVAISDSSPEFTILITSFNDDRIIPLIESVLNYNIKEILIADGGSSESLTAKIRSIKDERVRLVNVPGSIAESRNGVRGMIRGDITIFLDTDEKPTPEWIKKITEPIVNGHADFCFGPTIPLAPPSTRVERFVNQYDKDFYDVVVRSNPLMGPMGNSAWKSDILRELEFDTSLTFGGEDYDFNLKANQSGYRGCFVPEAKVYHDQSELSGIFKLLTKKFRYMVGAAVAYRRNTHLRTRLTQAKTPLILTNDPLEFILFLMKPLALIVSLVKY